MRGVGDVVDVGAVEIAMKEMVALECEVGVREGEPGADQLLCVGQSGASRDTN